MRVRVRARFRVRVRVRVCKTEDKPVAVEPTRVRGGELHDVGPQNVRKGRTAKRHTRVSGIRLRQHTQRHTRQREGGRKRERVSSRRDETETEKR